MPNTSFNWETELPESIRPNINSSINDTIEESLFIEAAIRNNFVDKLSANIVVYGTLAIFCFVMVFHFAMWLSEKLF